MYDKCMDEEVMKDKTFIELCETSDYVVVKGHLGIYDKRKMK